MMVEEYIASEAEEHTFVAVIEVHIELVVEEHIASEAVERRPVAVAVAEERRPVAEAEERRPEASVAVVVLLELC